MEAMFPGARDTVLMPKQIADFRHLRMGSVMDYANKLLKANCTLTKYVSDHMETYHYFGDPTMRIRTENPTTIESPIVIVNKDGYLYRLSVLSQDSGKFEYSVCEDGKQPVRSCDGIVDMIISDPSKVSYTVCINGDNKIPYYRQLTGDDIESINHYTMSAKYNAAKNSIDISYTTPFIGFAKRAYAWIEAYDYTGRFIGSTKQVLANGFSYDESISIPSFVYKAPYIVCLMLDGECVKSIKVSK